MKIMKYLSIMTQIGLMNFKFILKVIFFVLLLIFGLQKFLSNHKHLIHLINK